VVVVGHGDNVIASHPRAELIEHTATVARQYPDTGIQGKEHPNVRTDIRVLRWWVIAAAVVIGAAVDHMLNDIVAAWPLATWRVDRDDLYDIVMGFSALLMAGAAWRRAGQAKRALEDAGNDPGELELLDPEERGSGGKER